jgi:hypothetical protein
MLARLLSLLTRKPWEPSRAKLLLFDFDLPTGAWFFDTKVGEFIYGYDHESMMNKMGVPGGYYRGLDFLFKRGFLRGFYHTPWNNIDPDWQDDKEYIFLQGYSADEFKQLAERLVDEHPHVEVQYDVCEKAKKRPDWGWGMAVGESAVTTVRQLSGRKPSWVQMQRDRAIQENWPDPEAYRP